MYNYSISQDEGADLEVSLKFYSTDLLFRCFYIRGKVYKYVYNGGRFRRPAGDLKNRKGRGRGSDGRHRAAVRAINRCRATGVRRNLPRVQYVLQSK